VNIVARFVAHGTLWALFVRAALNGRGRDATHATRNAAISATAFALFSAIIIFKFNGRLIPDTDSYSAGKSAWSSPIMALAGIIGGRTAVQVFAVIFSSILGWNLGFFVGKLGAISCLIYPPGWSLGYAGADAAGAVGASFLFRTRFFWLVTGGLHLEALCVCLSIWICARFYPRYVPGVALGVAIIPQLLFWHIQIRYLLPGYVIFLIWRKLHERT